MEFAVQNVITCKDKHRMLVWDDRPSKLKDIKKNHSGWKLNPNSMVRGRKGTVLESTEPTDSYVISVNMSTPTSIEFNKSDGLPSRGNQFEFIDGEWELIKSPVTYPFGRDKCTIIAESDGVMSGIMCKFDKKGDKYTVDCESRSR